MRNEAQMYELILNIARQDDRVLAVYMNGSRTNKNAPKDIFQDYDIMYVVEETGSFIEDRKWIEKFGDILYMQYPDESPDYPADKENLYGWLMQFEDGNRIDLHVETISHAMAHMGDDKLCRVLLDKEHILPKVPEATDEDYWVKKPSKEQFFACCNEFWWCSNNIAKGLWRKELTYVQDMTNFVVRKELEKMLSWKVGFLTGFCTSVGKSAKYMNRWLSETEWEKYLSTYFNCNREEAWNAVLGMCDLFEETALFVSDKLGVEYNQEEGKRARAFLEYVRDLPEDAKEIRMERPL